MKAVEVNRIITSVIDGIYKIRDVYVVDRKNNGRLVHLYGFIEVEEPLTEPEYGLSVPAVILKRRVQMYQWVEKKEDSSGSSNLPLEFFHYENEWRDKLINSSKFQIRTGHTNPDDFPISNNMYISHNVKVGDYTLSKELKNKFNEFTFLTSDERPERHDIKMHAGLYYHTLDVWNPKVGDIRLQFSYAGNTGDAVSIIAAQNGSTVGGEGLLLLEKGKVSPQQMITNQHNRNMWLIRLCRTCGWLTLYFASVFFKSFFYYFAMKHKTVYLFLTLDRKISTHTSVSSVIMGVIICNIWSFYKPWIGLVMLLTFITPFVWCATFREDIGNTNSYKKM